jgi:hypothetical protein
MVHGQNTHYTSNIAVTTGAFALSGYLGGRTAAPLFDYATYQDLEFHAGLVVKNGPDNAPSNWSKRLWRRVL